MTNPRWASRTTVPGGTGITRSRPLRPWRLAPWPGRPFSARQRERWANGARVLNWGSTSSTTLSPSPPSPPSGPPRGTKRSRRKLKQPLPPRPAWTVISARSTNMGSFFVQQGPFAVLDSIRRHSRRRVAPWAKEKPDPIASDPVGCLLDVCRPGGEAVQFCSAGTTLIRRPPRSNCT